MKIPLYKPYLGEEEKKMLGNVIDSKMLSRGPFVEEFESEFAKYTNRKYAIAINTGTSGLHLCMRALGIQQDDEIITSSYSFIASANCILYEYARPIFCDINLENFLIDASEIKNKITYKTKAILPVDIFGNQFDASKIENLGLPIITDSCESFGNKPCKNTLANVFGFFPNKQITTGEGGIITTDDTDFAKKLRSLRNQGFIKTDNYLDSIEIGYNYRMSDINAALGLAQLKKADYILQRRFNIAQKYSQLLSCIPNITIPFINKRDSFFNYVILADSFKTREKIIKSLEENGIETNRCFPPLHYFGYINKATGYKYGDFPNAENIAQRLIGLPFWTELSESEIEFIVSVINKAI